MSYDLFMKPKNGKVTIELFNSYFSGRKNYELEGIQAWYKNDATGVYFLFEFQENEEGKEKEFPIVFNMNYFRPTFFVREAEPEVRELISKFDLIVDDPQINGMGVGEYNSDKFISGWLDGNEFGYKSILKDNSEVYTLPSSQLEEVWEWNKNKEKLQSDVIDDVFVPTIMFFNYQGKVVRACVWPDAIPSIIPPVDIMIIGRKELAPRRLFKKTEDMAIGMWNDFQPLLNSYMNRMEGSAYYLYYESVPKEIKKTIQKLSSIDLDSLERLSADNVLDEELVEKYLGE